MLFTSLLTLVAAASTAVFGESLGRDHKTKACTRELEAIVFTPPSCAHNYLREISRTLQVQAPLLFTDQVGSVVNNFENTYGVDVLLYDAFGNIVEFDGPEPPALDTPFSYNYERTVAIGEAFAAYNASLVFNFDTPYYVYSTLIWSQFAELYTAFIVMNKTSAPMFC